MYKIHFYKQIDDDLMQLPDDVFDETLAYFDKFQINPHQYSKPLFNIGGLNLEGYRKTYVANATYRIISKIEDGIVKVVEVVAVGKREDKEVYKEAHKRVND